jgi:hypothetical protein
MWSWFEQRRATKWRAPSKDEEADAVGVTPDLRGSALR